jgi:hypothetical protein
MQRSISEQLRRRGCAHVTIQAGVSCGVAITIGDRFVDLATLLTASREMGSRVTVELADIVRDIFQ